MSELYKDEGEIIEVLDDEELEEVSGGKVYGNGAKQMITYTVVRGDTMIRISNRFNTTIKSIMKLNPIIKDKRMIRTGWVLKICANDR